MRATRPATGSAYAALVRLVQQAQTHRAPSMRMAHRYAGFFLPVTLDPHCKVRGLEQVWAAGDATDFAVKMGGIAAHQADTAAREIAALAGAPVERAPFHPVIRGMLVSLDKPKYMSAQIAGGHGSTSEISDTPSWSPAAKIDARYLAPYLEQRDSVTGRTA